MIARILSANPDCENILQIMNPPVCHTKTVMAALGLALRTPSASTENSCDKYVHHLMNKDQGKTVSRAEFDAFWSEQFKLNDTDSNGNITATELHSPELHAALDANRDGNLDQAEYVAFFAPLFENNAPEAFGSTQR